MIDIHELSEEDIKLHYIGMENKGLTNTNDAAYQKLIDNITTLWVRQSQKPLLQSIQNCLMPTGKRESKSLNMNKVVNKELNMAKGYL